MAQTGFTPIQLYYSSTATNTPTAGNLAAGELGINITDGKLFYKDNSNVVQVIGWRVRPASAGGTGLTSFAVGDLIYADSTSTLAKLPDVATGNALISGGISIAPSWGKIGLTTHISGILPVANGGTNASSAGIASFNNITGYTASGATGTTSTNLVFSTSPSITTPTIVGDQTLSTGNVVISTTGKGITTGSSIPLGFGTNGSTSIGNLGTSGNLSMPGFNQTSTSLIALTYATLAPTPTFDGATCSVTVSSGNSIDFGANFSGLILVCDSGFSGCNALLLCGGGGTQVISNSTTTAYFTNTSASGDYRFYSSGGSYKLFASARSTVFKVTSFRTTAST